MEFYSRKSPRLPGYDYTTENYYFVTICTHNKECIFGRGNELSPYGEIVQQHLQELPMHYKQVQVDVFKVMPNHIHCILVLDAGADTGLDVVVGLFKSGVSKQIHKIDPDCKVWQRSFHERIIRSQQEYEKIWNYIQYNDQKWETDCFYPGSCDFRVQGGSRPSPTIENCRQNEELL